MEKKKIAITGANSGIGKSAAMALAKEGHEILMLCRDLEKAEQAKKEIIELSQNKNVILKKLDLADEKSIGKLKDEFPWQSLDVLLNNAGLYLPKRYLNEKGIEMMMMINYVGPFLLTSELYPFLLKGNDPRVVNVASDAHRMGKINIKKLNGDKKFKAFKQYGITKLANILFTEEFVRKAGDKIESYSLHPGIVATGFAQNEPSFFGRFFKAFHFIEKDSNKGAETSVFLSLEEKEKLENGKYYSNKKLKKSWHPQLGDEKIAKELWEHTEKLLGKPFNMD